VDADARTVTRSILAFEVRTGRRITQIPVSDAQWSTVHRGPGEVSIDIPLDATEFRKLERMWLSTRHFGDADELVSATTLTSAAVPLWRPGDGLRPELLASLEPLRCGLAVLEDDTVLEAGPIWAWDYEYGGTLKIKAAGLWSLLDRRYVVDGDASTAWASWAVTYSGLSLATIAKRLVQFTETQDGGELPIVLPADVTGTSERTYRGFELATVRSRIEQIMGVIDGPDIAFEPRLTTDRLGIEWVMRTGTTVDPLLHQHGDDHVWDSRVPQSPIGGLSVGRDAGSVTTRSWVTGAGQDEALLMARRGPGNVGLPDPRDVGHPLTEISEARSTVEDQTTLNRWADGNLRGGARSWQSWSADVVARPTARFNGQNLPAGPQLGQYRPGDWARVWVSATHPLLGLLLPAGFHRARIMEVSGGMGDQVKITLAPVMESR
jgi:hypothetical protein